VCVTLLIHLRPVTEVSDPDQNRRRHPHRD
jgi:hypothetical protein